MAQPRTRYLALLLTWIAAAGLLWLASRGADWSRAWELTRGARPAWLVIAVLANLSILALWAALWRRFVPVTPGRPTFGAFLGVATITSAVMNTVPLLVGHASAVMLLVRRARLETSTALSVLALDQLGEGITKLTVFALAALVVPLPAAMRAGIASISLGVAVLLLVLLLLHHRGERFERVRLIGPFIAGAARNLAVLRRPSVATESFLLALAMKGAEAAAIAAVMHAFGVDLPPATALVILAATNLATMLPVAPANLGAYEAAAAATYRWLGVPPDLALAVAVVQHACFLLPAIGAGCVTLAVDAVVGPGVGAGFGVVGPRAVGDADDANDTN